MIAEFQCSSEFWPFDWLPELISSWLEPSSVIHFPNGRWCFGVLVSPAPETRGMEIIDTTRES